MTGIEKKKQKRKHDFPQLIQATQHFEVMGLVCFTTFNDLKKKKQLENRKILELPFLFSEKL